MKLKYKNIKTLLKNQILHKLDSGKGWSNFTGVDVKNNSDATIYILFFSELDIDD